LTPSSGTTGDILVFNVSAEDHFKVTGTSVEYWFGTGPHTNVSMSGTGPYTHQITIPSNSTDTLHYIFHAVDDSGNWNQTEQKNVTILDNDKPLFGKDTTSTSGTTGEPLLFSIEVDDNIGVDEVYLEYWQGRKAPVNVSMNFTNGYYQYSVNVPIDYDEDFHYIFRAVDEAGNWVETVQKDIRITDNDRPEFANDISPATGTTGESYTFGVDATDNIGVDGVFVEYWFGTGPHSNVSMLETWGTYSHSITIPNDSLDLLHYIFHAVDDAGNWAETDQRNVSIRDNDPPIFGEDLTSDSGSTGDPFLFEVEVEDIIEIEGVWVSYWFGTGDAQDIQLTFGSGTYSVEVMIPSNLIDDMHYFFYADDTSDNTNQTDVKDVSILDNDRSIFGSDSSDSIATTGDEFRFGIDVTDNIEVDDVTVEYWFGEGPHQNVSVEENDPYSLTIMIPSDSLDQLHYIFHSVDTSGNWNQTIQVNIDVLDNDLPVFLVDGSDINGTTGDDYSFDIEIIDNIGIDEAYVEYWFGDGEHNNGSLDLDGTYKFMITIPTDSILPLHYIFHVSDTSENRNLTDEVEVQVIDNDLPELVSDETPTEAYTGEDVSIMVEVRDNHLIDMVEVSYRFGNDGEEIKTELTIEDSTYTNTITVPFNSTESLIYKIIITDLSGNVFESDDRSITVTDSISPTVEPVENITIYEGQELKVTIIASDNIGIASYVWEGAPIQEDGKLLKGTVTDPGHYDIIITISDEEGNTNSTSFKVTVLSEDHDTDSDGIPDLVEMDWNLTIDDPSDGEEDADNDGLRNYQEFLNGTKPFVSDTDDDGMLDGWEVQYGLDPNTPSANNDEDGDGKTDIDEFLDGTDPLAKEGENDDGISTILIVKMIILIILAIGIGIFLVMRNKKNKEEAESENPVTAGIQNETPIKPDEASRQENTESTYP
jgi:hypothetical protein